MKLAKVLMDARAGISAADKQGNMPLLATSAGGYLELAKVLVDAGAGISAANKQVNTPLLAASARGHVELAKALIDVGAGISAADKQGNTPLLATSAGGHLELAKVLIDAGANVEATRTDGAGLLALAIVSQKKESVIFAFQHGPRRLKGKASSYATSGVARLLQCFCDPSHIGKWLQRPPAWCIAEGSYWRNRGAPLLCIRGPASQGNAGECAGLHQPSQGCVARPLTLARVIFCGTAGIAGDGQHVSVCTRRSPGKWPP